MLGRCPCEEVKHLCGRGVFYLLKSFYFALMNATFLIQIVARILNMVRQNDARYLEKRKEGREVGGREGGVK